jgi:arginyl-tRNA synthetase
MASPTTTAEGLCAILRELGLDVPVPAFDGADVLGKPIDIWVVYLAELMVRLLECAPAQAYEAIHRVTATATEMGDLDIVMPRLRISPAQIEEWSAIFINKVCQSHHRL